MGVPIPASDVEVVEGGIEWDAWFLHDDRAVESPGQLRDVVEVRVVDERAGARHRQAGDKGIRRGNARRDVAGASAPSNHPVGETLQLQPVPVHGGGLFQLVDDGDVRWLTARENQRWTSDARDRLGRRF